MERSHHNFIKLNRASHKLKENGKAPHKPILLLAIIELMDEGLISENKIKISLELIATFQKLWLKLVRGEGWQPRFFLPFYHLTGDKIWHLKIAEESEIALTSSYSPKSIAALKDSIHYGYFESSIWNALSNPIDRAEIKNQLLLNYFPGATYHSEVIRREKNNYIHQLELNFLGAMVSEPMNSYLKIVEYEARSTIFKNEVPKIYNYSCSISGLSVVASSNIQMIDACHIESWSSFKNDTIQNGITLTPTLHRAFDRKIISIDENYRVIVSQAFAENENSPFNINQFKGKRILLPENERFYPCQQKLAIHRSKLL